MKWFIVQGTRCDGHLTIDPSDIAFGDFPALSTRKGAGGVKTAYSKCRSRSSGDERRFCTFHDNPEKRYKMAKLKNSVPVHRKDAQLALKDAGASEVCHYIELEAHASWQVSCCKTGDAYTMPFALHL